MSILLELQHQLQNTIATLAELERSFALHPESLALRLNLESVKGRFASLEAEFNELADRKALDVCKYRIFAPDESTTISLRGFSGPLREFQEAISCLFDAVKNGRRLRSRLTPDVIEATDFGFGYAFGGSVGVVLTMPHERLLIGGSLLDDTIATFFSVAKAPTPEDIQEIGRRLGPAPLRAIYNWASAHLEDSVGADISWRKGEEVIGAVLLQRAELERLRDQIAATSEETHEFFTLNGLLTGASVQTKRFDFLPDGGDAIGGSFTDAISENHVVSLPTRHSVRVEKVTKVQYSSDLEKTTWKLLSVDPAE